VNADRFTLRENADSGQLELQRGEPCGPWRDVPADEREKTIERERRRREARRRWTGALRGKTVVIFGAGPQLKRVTGEQVRFLLDTGGTAIAGVNALPDWCRLKWGLDPSGTFSFTVAADRMPPEVYAAWG
jgi:hypothetical protein